MPELPEIETIVRFLKPRILDKEILSLEIFSKRIIKELGSATRLNKKIVGQKIIGVDRAGKWIVFKLSSGEYFLFHLMMTGRLLLNPKDKNKHDRLILFLSGNTKLVFNDVRQFGKCIITSTLINLGEDALAIKFPEFRNLITTKNKIIKNFLLDQKNIAGIGNIYADEILWDTGIHPLRKTNTLKHFEILKLFQSVKNILRLAIKKGGTSSRDYRKPDDTKGEYYKIRKAYQRTGEKCSQCGGIIKRILVGGRSTHFCPKHQK